MRPDTRGFAPTLTLMSLLAFAPVPAARAEYALRDGDTVVFLGDSITAERTYGKVIENYTTLRFPGRRVRFINSGHGGDTAEGGLKRLDRDVFDHKATVLIVAYGINDIGWGTKADDAHKSAYLDAIRGILDRAQEHNVRVFLACTPITAGDPDKAEHEFLQRMCDEALEIARSRGEGAIDVQRSMRTVQRAVLAANARAKTDKDKTTLHTPDGVHLNELGQHAMALAILKGLGAPAEVSSATLDASTPSVVESQGCQVSNLKGNAQALEFDRLDDGLPLNTGLFGALRYRFLPIPETLNRYLLTLRGLPEGRYAITADDRPLGTFSTNDLAQGVNLASATANGWEPGGPWEAEAWELTRLTDARVDLASALAEVGRFLPNHPEQSRLREQFADADRQINTLRHTLVHPRPFHFRIQPATP